MHFGSFQICNILSTIAMRVCNRCLEVFPFFSLQWYVLWPFDQHRYNPASQSLVSDLYSKGNLQGPIFKCMWRTLIWIATHHLSLHNRNTDAVYGIWPAHRRWFFFSLPLLNGKTQANWEWQWLRKSLELYL